MTVMKAVVQLPANSALPRDVVELTTFWNFSGTPTSGTMDAIAAEWSVFFSTVPSGGSDAVGNYLARDRDYATNHAKVVWYVMPSAPGPTGPPLHTSSFTLLNPGATYVPLPDQVAVCLSFHGDLSTATHPARHRGRIFIGPLNTHALEETAGGVASQTVKATFMADLGLAAHALLNSALASGGRWSVFSRVDWDNHDVVGGWVDDRFDTQRRRLERADSRTLWAA